MKRCLVLLLFALSCDRPQFPHQTPEDIRAARVLPSDLAVYGAVEAAYASGQVLGAPPPPPPPPNARRPPSQSGAKEFRSRPKISLLEETDVREDALDPAPDRWYALSVERFARLDVPKHAVRDFQRRNKRAASLRDYKPKYLKVQPSKDLVGSPFSPILSLTLPGYSATGDTAVVEVSISVTGMGGGQLLFLRKLKGEWRVIASQQTWIS